MAERPEDLNLPISVVARIIKEALPDGISVSKDARAAMSKAASIFVLYATSCANNFAMQHKRKTISGPDVLEAMKEMDFERFVEPLSQALEAHKKGQAGKKAASEQRKKAKEAANMSHEEVKDQEEVVEDEAEEAIEEDQEANTTAGDGDHASDDAMMVEDEEDQPEK